MRCKLFIFIPVKYFSLALARSSASKYHTVMAYLRGGKRYGTKGRTLEQWIMGETEFKKGDPPPQLSPFPSPPLPSDLVEWAGCTSWGFRRSDQNSSSRSNLGSMSANWALPSGKIRRRPPCSWKARSVQHTVTQTANSLVSTTREPVVAAGER